MRNRKPILTLLMCVGMILSFAGWSCDGGAYQDQWVQTWYGWYEVLDASGEYASLAGTKQDCIVTTDIPDAFVGGTEGTFSLLDPHHYADAFFYFDGTFGDTSASLYSGVLEGQPMTVEDFNITPGENLDVENALWGEGTIGTEAGTMELRLFVVHWNTPSAWGKIKENTGELPLDWEELRPAHLRDYGAYYVRNEWAWEGFLPGLTDPLPDDTVTLRWKEEGDDWEVLYCCSGDSPLLTLHTAAPLNDFRLLRISLADVDEAGNAVYDEHEVLYEKEGLSVAPWIDKELGLDLHGDLPEYGIRFRDYHGREYFYAITVSGEDGTPLLVDGTVTRYDTIYRGIQRQHFWDDD